MLNGTGLVALYDRFGWSDCTETLVADRDLRLNLRLWALLAAMNIIDVLGTGRAFELGIGELNPIVASLHAGFGMPGIVLAKVFFLTLLFFLLPRVRTWTRALFFTVCAAYMVLTATHFWFLAPHF